MWDNTEVQKKIENIVAGVSGALNTPVAFATKTLTDNIGSINIPVPSFNHLPIGEEMQKSLTGVAARLGSELPTTVAGATSLLNSVGTQLTQLTSGAQSVMATVTNTVSSATSVISSIASTGQQVLSGVMTTGQQVISGTIAQATGLVSGITSSVTSSITGALSGTINAAVSALNVPSTVTGLVGNISSLTDLPKVISDTVSSLPGNILNTAANIVTGKVANTLSNMNIIGDTISSFISDFPGLKGISIPDIVTSMMSFNTDSAGNIREYAQYTDKDGNNLLNLINNNKDLNSKSISSLSSTLQDLCRGQRLSNSYPYRYNKNRYDGLLGIFSALGLADGLRGLLNCDSLFDTRSQRVLTNYGRPTSINNGDPYTYDALIDAVGRDIITSTPERDLLRLNSNMTLDDQDDNIHMKVDAFNTVATKLGRTVADMVKGATGGSKYPSTDTVKVLNMSKSNTKVISDNIEDAIIKTAIGSLYTFQGV